MCFDHQHKRRSDRSVNSGDSRLPGLHSNGLDGSREEEQQSQAEKDKAEVMSLSMRVDVITGCYSGESCAIS